MVESGSLAVDDFLFYSGVDRDTLSRTPIRDGTFHLAGADFHLTWPGQPPVPIRAGEAPGTPASIGRVASSIDLVWAHGRLYPRQAPAAALLGVPAYFVVHGVERALGLDPDHWWVLTVNSWVVSLMSVGLLSALACVLFFRVAAELWGAADRATAAAALTFAFATIWFPHATLFTADNPTAVCLLAGFYWFRVSRRPWLAGGACGLAAALSYGAIVPSLLVAAYGARRTRAVPEIVAGAAVPVALALVYHAACFGSPFAVSYGFPNMLDNDPASPFVLFGTPRPMRSVAVLFSPFRGLFFSSPVLLCGVIGWWKLFRRGRAAETALCCALAVYFLSYVASFRLWHGGWTFGPRVLIPLLPFLALGLVHGFRRARWVTGGLAGLSFAMMLLATAVDAQPPVGSSSMARIVGRPTLLREPVSEYLLPVFTTGQAGPVLRDWTEVKLEKLEDQLREQAVEESDVRARLERARAETELLIARGEGFHMAVFRGPVSANPTGIFEPWPRNLFRTPDPRIRRHSLNAGELLFPDRRASLWFLLVPLGILGAVVLLEAARVPRTSK